MTQQTQPPKHERTYQVTLSAREVRALCDVLETCWRREGERHRELEDGHHLLGCLMELRRNLRRHTRIARDFKGLILQRS
jgi:hypothetical protein